MLNPQIVWCAQSSLHYVEEASTRYSMPLFLAIQLKEHLKGCAMKNHNRNSCVADWVNRLTPQDRMLVHVYRHQVN